MRNHLPLAVSETGRGEHTRPHRTGMGDFPNPGWGLHTRDTDKCLKFIWSLSDQSIQDKMQQKLGQLTLNEMLDHAQMWLNNRTRTMGTMSDSTIMVSTEVKEKKVERGDPCLVHGTSRHSWDECRLKNLTSYPYCQEGIKEGMLNKHVSICKGKCCYECGHLRHMRAKCGVRSGGKRRRELDRSPDG